MSMLGKSTSETKSPTGTPGLDDILDGGLTVNRLYLLDGDPGTGKTTLALRYLIEGIKSGEKVLYITLSETREELQSVAESHGWSLKGLEILEIVPQETDLTDDAQLTMYHPSEVELGKTTSAILQAVEQSDARRIVIDSLSEIRLLAQSPLKYRRQILGLKQFFMGRQTTVLILDDQTSKATEKQIQSIAHGVIILEQLAPEFGAERRRLRVIKYRGTAYRGGFHDFTIQKGGLHVYPRLVAAEHREPFQRESIASGIVALDQLLGGGPDRGTSTLFIGPAGCGKSTIAIQYAVAAAERGEKTAIFAFDESAATMSTRMTALGCNFDRSVQSGGIRVQQIDPAEVSPGEFAHIVRQAVEEGGAKVIIIDSLNGYLNAMPEERFLTAQLHELLSYLGNLGITTLLVLAQHGLIGTTMQSPVDASYLADSVVLMRYFENGGRVRKAISVLKKRSGPHEETIRELKFSSSGIALSEPLHQFHGILTGVPIGITGDANDPTRLFTEATDG